VLHIYIYIYIYIYDISHLRVNDLNFEFSDSKVCGYNIHLEGIFHVLQQLRAELCYAVAHSILAVALNSYPFTVTNIVAWNVTRRCLVGIRYLGSMHALRDTSHKMNFSSQ